MSRSSSKVKFRVRGPSRKNCMQFSTVLTVVTFMSLADLGFFLKGGDFGNPSKRSERASSHPLDPPLYVLRFTDTCYCGVFLMVELRILVVVAFCHLSKNVLIGRVSVSDLGLCDRLLRELS